MRKSAKIITALSVTGLAVVAGSAFTGAGLTNNDGPTQFIGGTVNQLVTGATLESLTYGFGDDTTKTTAKSVVMTFGEDANGKSVDLVLTGSTDPVNEDFVCTGVITNNTITYGGSQKDVSKATITVFEATV
jgi:hypothetical protein